MATENKDMQQKRGTADAWTSDDTVLLAGEVGVETDTGRVKVGDGSTAWTSLGYVEASMDADDLPYDNATSGLAATDVQAAVDEVDGDLDTHKGAFDGDHGADHDARDHSTALGTAVWGDLSDVDMGTTAPEAGDTAVFDGANWVPADLDVTSDGLLAQTGAGALELVGRDTYQFMPGVTAGYFYRPPGPVGNVATTLDSLHVAPLLITGVTLNAIGVSVTTGGGASSVMRLGIYEDNGGGYPGALLLDAGTVASATAGAKQITISQALPSAGWYWLAAAAQDDTAPTITQHTAMPYGTPIDNLARIARAGLASAGVSGALPDPFPAGAILGNNVAAIAVKVA